jgi:BolA protein
MIAQTIETKLTRALDPLALEIVDESHLHAGHAGARPEGETHFRVKVVSRAFEGFSRIDRQRLVYQVLSAEMASRIHALTLETLTPDEDSEA